MRQETQGFRSGRSCLAALWIKRVVDSTQETCVPVGNIQRNRCRTQTMLVQHSSSATTAVAATYIDLAQCSRVVIVVSFVLCLANLLECPACESAGPVLLWSARALSVAAIAACCNLSPSLYEHSRGRGCRGGDRGGCTSSRCWGTGGWTVFSLAGSA